MSANAGSRSNSAVLDTGVLMELLGNTALGEKIKTIILKDPELLHFHVSPITVAELLYLVGRRLGFQQAYQRVDAFLEAFVVWDEARIRVQAAMIKTSLSLALADCYSIAIGIMESIPVFMTREVEMDTILKKGPFPFPVDIRFIEDI